MIFKNFEISKFNVHEDNYKCNSSKWFSKFLDKDTSICVREGERNRGHVRTMNLSIILYK